MFTILKACDRLGIYCLVDPLRSCPALMGRHRVLANLEIESRSRDLRLAIELKFWTVDHRSRSVKVDQDVSRELL
nr:Biomphalaria glabrata alpha-tocopherol transfer protein-like [Biomphalaria glabrata]